MHLLLNIWHCGRYVKSGAEKEINISGDLRNQVLRQLEKVFAEPAAAQCTAVASPFDPAEKEIRKLLHDGLDLKAFTRYAMQNISKAERRRRMYISMTAGLLSMALCVTLLFTVTDPIISRVARMSSHPLNFICVALMMSSSLGI